MEKQKAKPIMVIGPTGAGKSTLLSTLGLAAQKVKKTEAVVYLDKAIDTPGEMLAIPRYYNALILNSSRAATVLFIVDAGRKTRLPAKIALALRAPALGLISKIDQAGPEEKEEARKALLGAGIMEIMEVSALTGEGIEALVKRLNI